MHYSIANCKRTIPSLYDGLKPGQRKILYCALSRNLKDGISFHSPLECVVSFLEIKVSQLSGYVSEKTYYKHGEASLQSSIIAMAANYVGSNNIPFLQAVGQFGTRLEGGKVSRLLT